MDKISLLLLFVCILHHTWVVNGFRCKGKDSGCCTADNPCEKGDGDCDGDEDCAGGLTCGSDNCPFGDETDDCCIGEKYPNACKVNNGGCSHKCVSVLGVAKCECPKGYTLGSDDKTCTCACNLIMDHITKMNKKIDQLTDVVFGLVRKQNITDHKLDTTIGDIEAKIGELKNQGGIEPLAARMGWGYGFRGNGWPASGETIATRHVRSFTRCMLFCGSIYMKDMKRNNGCGWNPKEKLCKVFKNDQGHVAKNTQWLHFHTPADPVQ